MGREYKLAPFKEQLKLKKNLIRVETGRYVGLINTKFWLNGKEFYVPTKQDKLEDGLIKFPTGSYYFIDLIDKIEDNSYFLTSAFSESINLVRKGIDELIEKYAHKK